MIDSLIELNEVLAKIIGVGILIILILLGNKSNREPKD